MSPADPQPPGFWEAVATSLVGLGASALALFKSRDSNERIHKANGRAQEAINRVAVVEEAVRGIKERLGRIEDKLDRALEQR